MKNQAKKSLIVALFIIVCIPSVALAGKSNTQKAGDALAVLLPLAGFSEAVVKHDREGQMQFIRSFAANAVVTLGLKASIDKRRPNNGDCCDSFPSAHSSIAFMGATFIHRRYGRKYALPAYAAATFVGYSRIRSDKHFFVDVAAGAAIGFLSSYFLTTPYRGVTITPVAQRDMIGLSFNKRW